MATTKVSELAELTSPDGTEQLLVNDGGTSKRLLVNNLPATTPADDSITYAKIQNVSADERILGRVSGADGVIEELTKTQVLTFANVEDGADVTDTTNVTSAGALMDSELAGIAAVKATTGTFLTADQTKLDGIATSATVDQSASAIKTLLEDGIDSVHYVDDSIDADHLANSINTDIATGVTAGTTASAALPKAGGTMTGNLSFGDSPGTGSNRLRFGAGNDFQIWHNGTNSYLSDGGDGDLHIEAADNLWLSNISGEKYIRCISDGAIDIYHNNIVKLSTTANGITVTGTAIATTDTDTSNSGTVDLDFAAKQNFVLTLTGNITSLTASNEQVGQSGFITFIQDGTGSRTVSLHGDYETAAGAGLTLTSTASATDIVPYVVAAASRILLGTPQLAFS